MSRCAPHVSSQEHSLVYKMNCHRERRKQQAPDVLNISCTIHTTLSNNNCTAPRCDRQTDTVFTVLTKIDTRVDSTGKDSGDTEAQLKTSRVATGKYLYQTRESPQKWKNSKKKKFKQGKMTKNEKMKEEEGKNGKMGKNIKKKNEKKRNIKKHFKNFKIEKMERMNN